MIRGVTKSGLEFEVDENRVNDMEVIDAMVDMADEDDSEKIDLSKFSKMIRKVLSDEMKKKLYDHVRTEDGRSPIDAVAKEFFEIMRYNGDTKNS